MIVLVLVTNVVIIMAGSRNKRNVFTTAKLTFLCSHMSFLVIKDTSRTMTNSGLASHQAAAAKEN